MPSADSTADGAGLALQPEPSPRSPLLFGLLAVLLPSSAPLFMLGLWAVEQGRAQVLPSYTLSLAGVSNAAAPLLDPAAFLDLTLRPNTRVFGPVGVRAALLYDTGLEPWPVPIASSPMGTFRLHAPLNTLPPVRPGLRQLVFLIGRPHELPLLATEWPAPSAALQILRQPIEIRP